MSKNKKALIITGEHSGEELALEMVTELQNRGYKCIGTGGDRMQALGFELWEHIDRMSAVGVSEVAKKYVGLRRLTGVFAERAKAEAVEFAVLVDYPGFNLILARKLKALGIPVFFYVSAQVWAWHSSRIHKYKEYGRHMFCLFPFEVDIYKEIGMPASYHGHPIRKRIREELQTPFSPGHEDYVCLMPGSRTRELENLYPVMLATVLFWKGRPESKGFGIYIPTVNNAYRKWLEEVTATFINRLSGQPDAPSAAEAYGSDFDEKSIQRALTLCEKEYKALVKQNGAAGKTPPDVLSDFRFFDRQALPVINQSRTVITASGTATLEIGFLKKPMIILYKISRFTYMLFKMLVKVKHVGIVNVLAGREICPEFFYKAVQAKNIYPVFERILNDKDFRRQIESDLESVANSLDSGKGMSEIVDVILNSLAKKPVQA